MNRLEIRAKLKQECKELSEPFVVNVVVNQRVYNQTDLLVVDCLRKKVGGKGLYISLNKPYEIMLKGLKKHLSLDPNKLFFIDGVSKMTGKFSNSDKCFCLEDPSSLIELSSIIKALCDEKKVKFILLESLATLLIYNDERSVEKFAHSLVNEARKSNISVVILSPKAKEEEDVLAFITQFCDKEVEL